MATLIGTAGANTLIGGAGDDSIEGLGGNDTIRGAGGADTIVAGAGDDRVILNTDDVGAGERLDGGAGFDTLVIASNTSLAQAALVTGFERLQLIGDVTLTSLQLTAFAEIAAFGVGMRQVFAATASTYNLAAVQIGPNLTFVGSVGNDRILGGSGNETIRPGAGSDTVLGGGGDDRVILNTNDVGAGERLDGGEGMDTLVIATATDLAPAALVTGFERLELRDDVTLTGSQLAGFDEIVSTFGSRQVIAGVAGTYDLRGVQIGSNVTFVGSAGSDRILGGQGNETIRGGAGADTIVAGGGDDRVVLNTNDVGAGERLSGGDGFDTLVIAGTTSLVPAAVVTGFERLEVRADVTLTASQLAGFAEITSISSFFFTPKVIASGAGVYDLSGRGSARVDLVGTDASDTLIGGAGRNLVSGGGGNDLLDGGANEDRLLGGAGADTFLMRSGEGPDSILDFEGAGVAGGDVLQLAGFGAGASLVFVGGVTYRINTPGGPVQWVSITSTSGQPLGAGDYVFT